MKNIYLSITGDNTLIGNVVLSALYFLEEPIQLIQYADSISIGVLKKSHYVNKFLTYQDYYVHSHVVVESYESLNKYKKIKSAAELMVLDMMLQNGFFGDEITLHSISKIPQSSSLPHKTYKSIDDNPRLKIAHGLAYHYRYEQLRRCKLLYPKYDFMRHFGSKSDHHYEEIILHGLCPLHDENSLDYVAKYLLRQINSLDTNMVEHFNLLKCLPVWWQVASKKHSLYDYCESDEERAWLKRSAYLIKHKLRVHEKVTVLLLPITRKFPRKFIDWRKAHVNVDR